MQNKKHGLTMLMRVSTFLQGALIMQSVSEECWFYALLDYLIKKKEPQIGGPFSFNVTQLIKY